MHVSSNHALDAAMKCYYTVSKFKEVSKLLSKYTDANGRVKFLARWSGFGRGKFNSFLKEKHYCRQASQV